MSNEPRLKKLKKSPVVAATEKIVDARLRDNQIEDLEKISLIWTTMLDLDSPILPSQAAALLCVSDLVRATTLVDSEKHWIEAAALAIAGAHSDRSTFSGGNTEEKEDIEGAEPSGQIGFVASSKNQA